jgi:hypothetical protein
LVEIIAQVAEQANGDLADFAEKAGTTPTGWFLRTGLLCEAGRCEK